jgi:chromosome segregation ATPase
MPRHIRIPCPECTRTLRVRPEYVGRQVQCKHCQHHFAIPKYIVLTCPECRQDGMIRTEQVGREFRCKHCGSLIPTDSEDSHPSLPPVSAPLGVSTEEPAEPDFRVRSLEAELEKFRAFAETQGTERAAAMQQLGDAHAQIAELNARMRMLQNRLADTQGALEREVAVHVDIEEVRSEVDSLRTQVLALHGRAEEAERLETELEARSGEVQQLQSDLQSSRDDLKRLSAELHSSRDEIERLVAEPMAGGHLEGGQAGLHSSYPAAEQTESELQSASSLVDGLRDELRASQDALAQTLEDLQTSRAEIARLEASHQTGFAEADRLREDLRSSEDRVARLDQDHRTSRLEVESLQGELHAVHTEYAAIVSVRSELQAEFDRLVQTVRDLERVPAANEVDPDERARWTSELAAEQAARSQLAAERNRLEADLHDAGRRHQSNLAEMGRELDEIRQRETAASQHSSELARQLGHLQAELDQQRHQQERERHQHQQNLAALMHDLDAVRAEVSTQREAPIEVVAANAADDSRLTEAQESLKAATTRADSSERELRAARSQVEALCRDLALLQLAADNTPTTSIASPVRSIAPTVLTHAAEGAELASAKRQIEELTVKFQNSQREVAHLRSALDALGVTDNAYRWT